MSRYPDWPTRLAARLDEVRHLPFAWASNDCCSYAAGAVLAITGVDHMEPHRGKYKTKVGAARMLAKAGGLEGWVRRCLGEPLQAPAMAMRGDVVMFAQPEPYGPHALGICVGPHIAAPGEHGTQLLPMSVATLAWRV
jgi:hypothetical protein